MKRILITGANSYIGTSFEKYIVDNSPDAYAVSTLDMIGENWRKANFAEYDCIFHVAGIAHQKETKENAHLYYEVNRDLAIEVAKKAKAEGVGQFIFLSTMSVYGKETGVITKGTKPSPKSNYGRAKLEAEEGISPLNDEGFKVCILRPPMVYGKDCKGNFVKIKKLVERLPFFPYVKNQRSLIYIDNLSSFVKICIDNELEGLYFPQNDQYVSTLELAQEIGDALNKKVRFEYISGLGVVVLRLFYPLAKKAFGTLIYDVDEDIKYCVVGKAESIKRSV